MKVLVAGGRGYLGSALVHDLRAAGHDAWILSRRAPENRFDIQWDGISSSAWGQSIEGMDVVVNLTGYSLSHWPWTTAQKQKFIDSRVLPARALVSAIEAADSRPGVFIQISGINYYGIRATTIADETTPPGTDYLAHITLEAEAPAQRLTDLGVRYIVARSGVALAPKGGMLPLMSLPVRLFIGGPSGDGQQAMPWIHLADLLAAFRFLMEHPLAAGPFNLVAPGQSSNAQFMQALAKALHRPYWFKTPRILMRAVLGEMSDLVLEGRFSQPRRLLDLGFQFQYATIDAALTAIIG
jgi:uncharacterized protein (TIGR01777 family)